MQKVPDTVAEYEILSHKLKQDSSTSSALHPYVERRGSGAKGAMLVRDISVTLSEYKAWQEVHRSLGRMEQAILQYSYQDGHFSSTNILRAAKAVARVTLTPPQVWAIFRLFDAEGKNELHHDQFVRLLKPTKNTDPRIADEGLGLSWLFSCLSTNCSNCVRNWYDGTTD